MNRMTSFILERFDNNHCTNFRRHFDGMECHKYLSLEINIREEY
jgi:hypothetical protein